MSQKELDNSFSWRDASNNRTPVKHVKAQKWSDQENEDHKKCSVNWSGIVAGMGYRLHNIKTTTNSVMVTTLQDVHRTVVSGAAKKVSA